MRIYFDANIWINYLWGIEPGGTHKQEIQKMLDGIGQHIVVTSIFLHTEISAHFRDWIVLQKIIREGRSYRELGNLKKQKKYNSLLPSESDKINSRLEHISALDYVDTRQLEGLDDAKIALFSTLTLEYHLEFPDAMHVVIAMAEGCACLVTNDEEMRDKTKEFLNSEGIKEKDFSICSLKEFLEKY